MFRKLKDRIAEEVRQSPIRLPATVQSLSQSLQQLGNSNSETPVDENNDANSGDKTQSKDLIKLSENKGDNTVCDSSVTNDELLVNLNDTNQFSIGDDEDTASSTYSPINITPMKNPKTDASMEEADSTRENSSVVNVTDSQQRASSYHGDDQMTDAALLPVYSSPTLPKVGSSSNAQHQHFVYNLQSDIESTHSEMEELSYSKGAISSPNQAQNVDHMIRTYEKVKGKLLKYKKNYRDVVQAYRELHNENIKIKQVLSESQDKALRRMSELREQCQLEQKAKAHLEENLRINLEEKDQVISVLKTQVKLLKQGDDGTFAADSNCRGVEVEQAVHNESSSASGNLLDISTSADDQESTNVGTVAQQASADESTAAKDKIKRLETLLSKCKETIKNHKMKNLKLAEEKENFEKQLDEKIQEISTLKESFEGKIKELNDSHDDMVRRLDDVMRQQEEGSLGIAENKRQMFEEFESKENLIKSLKQRAEKFEAKKQEWLRTEKALDEEKQGLIAEFSRGKAAAIMLIKQEEEKKVSALKHECEDKIKLLEMAHARANAAKVQEMENQIKNFEEKMKHKLSEKEEEMKLAIEERELQKMAALSEQDTKADQLNIVIENLKTKELEILSSIQALKDELKGTKEDCTRIVKENDRAHECELDELSSKHDEELKKIEEDHRNELENNLEELKIEHSMSMETIKKQNEELLQKAGNDLVVSLQEQIELVKVGHQQVVDEHLSTIDRLKENLEHSEESFVAEKDENRRLSDRLEQSESDVAKSESEMRVAIEERDSMEMQLSTALDAADEESTELKARISNLERSVDQLNNDKRQMADRINILQSNSNDRVIQLSNTVTELEAELQRKTEQLRELEDKSADSVKECERLIVLCDRLNAEISDAEKRTTDAEMSLKREIDEAQRVHRQELQEMSVKVAEMATELGKQEQFAVSSEEKNKERAEQLSAYQQTVEEYRSKLKEKNEELGCCTEELECCTEELEGLKSENEKLNKALKSKIEWLEAADGQIADLKVKLSTFAEENFHSERENLYLKIAEMEESIVAKNGELEDMSEDNRKLKVSVEESSKSLKDVKNLMSAMNEHFTKDAKNLRNILSQLRSEVVSLKNEGASYANKQYETFTKILSRYQREFEEKLEGAEIRRQEDVALLKVNFDEESKVLERNHRDATAKACDDLSSRLSSAECRLDELKAEKQKELVSMVEQHDAARLDLNSQLEASRRENYDHEQYVTELKQDLERAAEAGSRYEKEISELRRESERREMSSGRLIDELKARCRLVDELQAKLEESDKLLEEARSAHEQNLCDAESEWQEKHRIFISRIDQLQNLVGGMEKEKDGVAEENGRLKERMSEQSRRSEMELKSSLEEIAALSERLRSSQDVVERSADGERDEIDLLRREIDAREDSLNVIAKEKQAVVDDLEDCRSRLNDLKSKFDDDLQLKTDEVRETAGVRIDEWKRKHDETRSMFESEKRRAEELASMLEDSQKVHGQLEAQVTGLNDSSQEKLTDLKRRAEMKLSQIKKQLQNENEEKVRSIENELSAVKQRLLEQEERLTKEHQAVDNKNSKRLEERADELKLLNAQLEEAMYESEQARKEWTDKMDNMEHQVKVVNEQKFRLEKELKMLKDAHSLAYGESSEQQQNREEIELLKEECQLGLDRQEAEHQNKLKMIVREFTQRLEKQEQDYERMLGEYINKGSREENQMQLEHQKVLKELDADLEEKTTAIEEVREYYHDVIKKKEEAFDVKIEELEENWKKRDEERNGLEDERRTELSQLAEQLSNLEKEKSALIEDHTEELSEMEYKWEQHLKQTIHKLETKHREALSQMSTDKQNLEKQSQLAMSAVESGSGSSGLLRKQIMSMSQEISTLRAERQAEKNSSSGEIERLKSGNGVPTIAANESSCENNVNIPSSTVARHASTSVPQATEIEYLKNIFYEYLMGKETLTMVKVISAVLKFTDDQTKHIIEREEARQSLRENARAIEALAYGR